MKFPLLRYKINSNAPDIEIDTMIPVATIVIGFFSKVHSEII